MLVAPLYDERKEIVVGTKAVGAYDIPDDGEPGAAPLQPCSPAALVYR